MIGITKYSKYMVNVIPGFFHEFRTVFVDISAAFHINLPLDGRHNPMLPHEQMRIGAQILAAIFGGPGIFYVWRSFENSGDALTALFYLTMATVLALYAGAPIQIDGRRALVRCRALLSKRRRP
jgi:hypothetical protein